ncbi:TonB-dependent receptor [Xanthomonas phaseoli]|uniref:TonB-dependent receptor n=1 Tax=Xanthomonas phaseoli pv. dieffenbachiae TaxID=92828 RepID=A0A1V9HCY6_9XANT|nr:TonB-dependent receptor [Xanthomonas phaseoli]MBO9787186.1 TonB-dependent receptor [Xanthomonas phaseoli pv. dieffenbachiae]MBO9884481.1 TonB-dependent receptor [Xanthomonas phaseoli pv. dieffenbachiae]MBO9915332.1 TonB-dependent receptor [Xanthomonas phaseoli pv. dieffenbachiae]MBO9939311.1 TonB-dependent receptor [Xanthomonas phaseoli pv. dieffenbachiae]MBO9996690.1 TonB-dependent receptor [Xanthomonas phaseoli pv. dieffenbachiae]
MRETRTLPRTRRLTSALLFALSTPLAAQTAPAPQPASTVPGSSQADPATLDTVQVSGIRGSLTSSMNVKRDAQGIVDGIVAEDIGKFPDTNLAESLQRISGVSIDRSLGEGSRVTVRGVGPDFNLVLLNGRQMPGASIEESNASNSRAFDFANLASESISGIEVFKTSRASTPTGGIGATINIKTARPLDNPGMHANVGLKGVHDSSNENLPGRLQGDSLTPEISGIFSNTSADGRFGVSLSGSYQERDFGYSQVGVPNGWRAFRGDSTAYGTIPQPGAPGSENIVNRPGPNDIYSVPQNLNYRVVGVERQRTNGQLVLQYKPLDNITTTLDYTYSENEIQQQRNEMSVWFNYGPSASSWTKGPVAGPITYSEIVNPPTSDLATAGSNAATRNQNKSLGFNVDWAVNDQFKLNFDIHRSTAEAGADSPYGSSNSLGVSGFYRGTSVVDFSKDFPVLQQQLGFGLNGLDPSRTLVTGSAFRNSYMKSEIDQAQVNGDFTFENYSQLKFGIGSTEVKNRSAFSNVQRDTWGGNGTAADYPDDLWIPSSFAQYFDAIDGSGNPAQFNQLFLFDFERARQAAAQAAGDESLYRISPVFTTDRRVTEKSKNAYLQWGNSWDDLRVPISLAAGVRYEETKVEARALVPVAVGIDWVANNELPIRLADSAFSGGSGKYEYWLPSLDLSFKLREDLVLRGSYGETIGRPGWGDIQGGQTLNQIGRIEGGSGQEGNPGLKPLLSHNIDLSLEWYYGDASYASVGFFRKNIDNYVGVTTRNDTSLGLHTPVGGAYWNQALANGCATADLTCIRNYIFRNFAGQPGVVRGTDDTNGNATGTISGQPGDPVANFSITAPANQRSASLDGWEFNVQHMFGQSGFGVSANYTKVDSGLTYNNYVIGEQFALEGLSDSANLVGFYDKGQWQVRAAYNWRDEFLAARFDGSGLPNPVYTEAYGQLDLSIGYQWTDNLSLSLEAINLTNEIQRQHGRQKNEIIYATQTGPRYMLGLRYKFW